MKKIAIIYWPKGGSVDRIAGKLSDMLTSHKVEKMDISSFEPKDYLDFDLWIVGGSTVGAHSWEDAEKMNPWFAFFQKLKGLDLSTIKVALYGLGDQLHYPHHFVDDLGYFQKEFSARNVQLIGQWPVSDYEFYESKGAEDGYFYGLALDEDSQAEKTNERLTAWVKMMLS